MTPTLPERINRTWAAKNHACRESFRRFFAAHPRGLKLTRRNLKLAARTVSASDLSWLAMRTLNWVDSPTTRGLRRLVCDTPTSVPVRSLKKKQRLADAIADALKLP